MMQIVRDLRAMLAHIMAGADWNRPRPEQLERDWTHIATGISLALTGWAGALYLWVGIRKQDADGAEPGAKRDSWIDKAAIIVGVVLGWALLVWIAWLAGWQATVVFCVAWSVALVGAMAWKAYLRRER